MQGPYLIARGFDKHSLHPGIMNAPCSDIKSVMKAHLCNVNVDGNQHGPHIL
jgi:hypothetical protein